MGAALTYARRYALFTLAGIAGEDDLDAPDLNAPEPLETRTKKSLVNGQTRPAERRKHTGQKSPSVRVAEAAFDAANPALKGQLSAVLRDQLLSQIKEVHSVESATIWARRTLPAKNTLSAADARQVEDAFRSRLAELNDREGEPEALRTILYLDAQISVVSSATPAEVDRLRLPRASTKANYPIPSRAGFATVST